MEDKAFKQIAHVVARAARAELLSVDEPAIVQSFHAARIMHEGATIYLLCSEDNVWAFSTSYRERGCHLDFVDSTALSTALRTLYGIDVMSAAELNGPFSPRPGMSMRDIRYWKPGSLGEGIFNYWD